MTDKPELIIFSQYLLGGGASFHRNMLANMPENNFDLKVIYHYPKTGVFSPSVEFYERPNDVIFEYKDEGLYPVIKRLSTHISNREGAIVTNLDLELYCLGVYPRHNKTIYFICHDDGFLHLAKKFNDTIDVFIAHNIEVFNSLKSLLPNRIYEIFFIPHGVSLQNYDRPENSNRKLTIAYLARHHVLKGLYDLPKINQLLLDNKIEVDWLIMGDGNERVNFIDQTKHLENFIFAIPKTNEEVIEELKKCDIFILPSRKDGLPVALLEAMSVGCVPVVSNFSEGIKKVVTENIGYIVDVGNNVGFAECITKLHRNRYELKVKSKNAIDSINKNYNIKDQARQYLELYLAYRKYKKVRKKRFFVRSLKKTYYFAVSKISNPILVSIKRKLFASINQLKNK